MSSLQQPTNVSPLRGRLQIFDLAFFLRTCRRAGAIRNLLVLLTAPSGRHVRGTEGKYCQRNAIYKKIKKQVYIPVYFVETNEYIVLIDYDTTTYLFSIVERFCYQELLVYSCWLLQITAQLA